eukprot:1161946-Pelagomonas_calceolata.AAC.3
MHDVSIVYGNYKGIIGSGNIPGLSCGTYFGDMRPEEMVQESMIGQPIYLRLTVPSAGAAAQG